MKKISQSPEGSRYKTPEIWMDVVETAAVFAVSPIQNVGFDGVNESEDNDFNW